jgi:hypothetical protein
MSRSRIDWEKGKREHTARLTVQAFAIDRAQDDEPSKFLVEYARGEKIKGSLRDYVRQHKPHPQLQHIKSDSFVLRRLMSESHIRLLERENKRDGMASCLCEMNIDYSYGHLHLSEVDFLSKALAATRAETNYKLLFRIDCPQAVFGA